MSSLEQYAQDLHSETLSKCSNETNLLMREEVFTESILEILSEHNELFDAELCYYDAPSVGRIPAAKLNAWSMSGDKATLDLVVVLYHGTGKVEEVGKVDVRRYFKLLQGFLRRSMDGYYKKIEESCDAFSPMQQIHGAGDSLTTVRLFFITDGHVRSLDIEEEPFKDLEVKYVLWDLEKLSRLRVGEHQEIVLDFVNDYGGAIPCIKVNDATKEYSTLLAFLKGDLLAKIYGQFGQRLLEKNVRAFLQVKGKVNKGLQTTLLEEPHRFLAYNNGLCCTAATADVEVDDDGHAKLKKAVDFQIVNGGQTTASIYHVLKKEEADIENVLVQVKLTVFNDPSLVPEVVPLVSKYANSQNKINAADFSANGPFHHNMEKLSRTVWAPAASGLQRGTHWYYERARGSYADDKNKIPTPSQRKEWEKQNPAEQKFTKTDLAKFENAWIGLPHFVSRGAEKNFIHFTEQQEDFGIPDVDQEYFQYVIAKAILWKQAEKVFDKLELVGYRANTVAFAISWLSDKSKRKIDLVRIWREQGLSEELSDALKRVCKASHKYLTSLTGNISEMAKKMEVWEGFRSFSITLDDNWENVLGGVAYTPRILKRATPEADFAITSISDKSAEWWIALSRWARERGFFKSWEHGLISSLGKYKSQNKLPTTKQALHGMQIAERAIKLGFKKE